MSKKWYTNGVKQVLAESCPEGYTAGRLPVSEETRRKHSENNGWKTMSEDVKAARAKKISDTINKRTDSERLEYSNKISAARKGKGVGNIPWNKGTSGLQTAWNKGLKMTEEAKQHLRDVYNSLPEDEKLRRAEAISRANRNKKPWNVGKRYTIDPTKVKIAKEKEIITKKRLGNFQSSSLEANFLKRLLNYFDSSEIETQYFDKNRYPFDCDFYIKPLDLFIELHGNWTHGYQPYNKENKICVDQLKLWGTKAKESDYYKNAIYTWTDLDVRKLNCANKHNLNYAVLYNSLEIDKFFIELAEVLNNGK